MRRTIKLASDSFNSTRYIRNKGKGGQEARRQADFQLHTVHQELRLHEKLLDKLQNLLSTPHGTLGTMRYPLSYDARPQPTFNSTRYIRNTNSSRFFPCVANMLSTPHGTLGTRPQPPSGWLVGLSTPHGTLGTKSPGLATSSLTGSFQLHTVHQEPQKGNYSSCLNTTLPTFNSTRYIRNSYGAP